MEINGLGREVDDNHGTVTVWLQRLRAGDQHAAEVLIEFLYQDLHAIARNRMRYERPSHTLQATALVNEAYMRLVHGPDRNWQNRLHFLAAASQAMRRFLIDHARRVRATKHGGGKIPIPLNDRVASSDQDPEQLIALDTALNKLQDLDAELAQVVELRFFGGQTHEEVAELLGVTSRTIKRRWETARAWLKAELNGEHG